MSKNARKKLIRERRRTCCPTCKHSRTDGTVRFMGGQVYYAECWNCNNAMAALTARLNKKCAAL